MGPGPAKYQLFRKKLAVFCGRQPFLGMFDAKEVRNDAENQDEADGRHSGARGI